MVFTLKDRASQIWLLNFMDGAVDRTSVGLSASAANNYANCKQSKEKKTRKGLHLPDR